MTRATAIRCVAIFDRLRPRVGPEAAMEQALEFATVADSRRRLADAASNLDPAAAAVIYQAAQSHGKSVRDLRGKWALPVRDEAVYLVRALLGVSYPALGRYFGRHHASLITGNERFERRLATNQILAARIAKVVGGEKREAAVAA